MEQVTNVSLVDKNGKEVFIQMEKPNIQTGIVEIHLVNSILDVQRQPYTIEFTNVTGMIRDDNLGIYLGDYLYENEKRLLLATAFRPAQARFAFPCFDEPSMKANVDISLTVPKTFTTVVGNTKITSEVNVNGSDLKTIHFEETPQISTHQIAFVISTFDRVSLSINSYEYNIYFAEGNVDYVEYAADITTKVVNKLEDIFHHNYSTLKSPELNQFALPSSFFKHAEYFGVILYRQKSIFYDINKSSLDNRRWIFIEIAQILSRLWLANFISAEWWSHIWLIDGLGIYLACKIATKLAPEMELNHLLFEQTIESSFEVDGNFPSLPLTSKIEDVYNISSIKQKERVIDFFKAPCIFLMIETIMGEQNMFASIRKVVDKYNGRNINPKNMFDTFESEGLPSGKMQGWAEESGYPVVTVRRVNNSAVLSQKRFLLQSFKKSNTKWHIPITFASKTHNNNFANVTPSHWLSPNQDLIIEDAFEDSDWIVVNLHENGYYRVNYEEPLWSSILHLLNSENFGGLPPIMRARLVNDVMNMARVMRQSYRLAMEVTKYLEKETDYYPWLAAYKSFSFLLKRIGKNLELKELLKKYVAILASRLSKSLKIYEASATDSSIQVIKSVLHLEWFCDHDYPDYATEARKKFELYMINPSNSSINANYHYAVYCYGIKNGSASDWNFLFEQFKKTSFPIEKEWMLCALGCSKEAVTLTRYLELTLDPALDIKKEDYMFVFRSVCSSNVDVAQTFFQNNIDAIGQRYANWDAFSRMLLFLTEEFTTVAQIAEFKIFAQNNQEELKEAFGDLVQSYIHLAEANVKWLATFEDELTDWLTEELANRSSTASSYPSNIFRTILFTSSVFFLYSAYVIL